MGLAEEARLAIHIDLTGNATRGVGGLSKQLAGLQTNTGRVGKGFGQISTGLARAGLLVGGAAVTGLAATAKAAIDFQDAFQGVVKTVDEADLKSAGLTFQGLSDSIRKMSTEMPNSAIELAGIAEQAGALGIKAKDIEAFTRQVAILASTTNVTADDAATALGQLQNVIGLTGDEFDNFAAALVDLGNKGASTEANILEIARRSGAAGKLIGIAKDETLGWSAAAANLGLEQELAGTSLQRFFLQTQNIVSGKGLPKMAKIAGQTAKSFKKSFEKDASGAMEKFLRGLGKMPKDARLAAVQNLFGKGTGLTRLILGLSDSIDKNLDPSLKTSTQAWKDATAAQIEFEKRNATVKSAISRLSNVIIDGAVSIGEGFTPALGRAADKLSAFLKQDANRSKLKSIGEDIGKAIDGIDWDAVIKGAGEFVGVMKTALSITLDILDRINKLPTEIKAAAAALLVLNKASGGLIGAGVGNVAGGLAGAAAQGLGSRVPGVGKLFAQPVFVTNWPIGGLPGGGGGVNPVVAGAGLTGAAALGIAGLGVTASIVGAVNSPLWVKNTTLATKLENQGLTQAERAAQIYYTASAADQAQMRKRISILPTKADFASGNAKLKAGLSSKFDEQKAKADLIKEKAQQTAFAVKDADTGISAKVAGTTIATRVGSSAIVAAVRASRPITTVNVQVTANSYTQTANVTTRYGSTSGSRQKNNGSGLGPGSA